MTNESLELLMHRNSVLTEEALRKYYPDDDDLKILFDAERYSLFAGGKRIRPMLTLEFCRLFGGEEEVALPFACAVEMIHTYSLIHDDLPCMDDDELRRGKPCNHKVFGEGMALLAGDALLTGAFEATAGNTLAGPEISALAVAYLANCVGRCGMIGGQVMDIEGEGKEMGLESLIKLHSLKTGALIGASCVLGALAGGLRFDDPCMIDVVTYSENIGLVFQIIDDILDATATEEQLGKSTGGDEKRKKNTFLNFYSVEEARFYAEQLTREAVTAIKKYPDSDALVALAEWLLVRNK